VAVTAAGEADVHDAKATRRIRLRQTPAARASRGTPDGR